MIHVSPKCSPVFGWVPPDHSSTYVPEEALANMNNGIFKPARTSDWFVVRSVPMRVTIVDPNASKTIRKEKMEKWVCITRKIAEAIDCLSGEKALKPASVDVTIYLWKGKKWLLWSDSSITPKNVNTGVNTRHLITGKSSILVYRQEEAVKTLVHEMLHAYRFGDWANDDEEMHRKCESFVLSKGISICTNEDLKPTEALVDAMAVRLAVHLFGGRTWSECLSYAERLSDKLVRRCCNMADGIWKQTTGAFEYYCVKPLFMRRMNDFIDAHMSGGLQKPDKKKVRSIFGSLNSVNRSNREYSLGQRQDKAGKSKSICLRMTPHSLAPNP